MTPEERQLISDLFDRMRRQGPVEKDREAEALIRDMVRQMPDAPYMMVQTVLVQEMALQNAQARVEELQERVQALETIDAPPQSQGSGSFLGGLLGGGSRSSAGGSVPSVGRSSQSSGFSGTRPTAAGSPWGGVSAAAPQSALDRLAAQQQPMQQGGFMRSALTTAAGVAGGMLAANAISSMFKGDTAQAAQPAAYPPAADQTPVTGQNDQDTDSSHGNDDGGDVELGFDDGGDWDLE
ncbi:MAG: DUF2076 domain-containing protein [Hyphomicrobiaceae bacterium]